MIQEKLVTADLFELEKKYSSKIKPPIYTPSLNKPSIYKLYDDRKTKELLKHIEESSVTEEEKVFLREAAKRHTVFNYKIIADYYANSGKEMQELMEESALVIIDFNKAIEYGFVDLSNEIVEQYLKDTTNEEN